MCHYCAHVRTTHSQTIAHTASCPKLTTLSVTVCFPRLASLLSLAEAVMQTELMLTSNELSVMFRTTTNGDLCDFLRRQYNCYRMQYFACTLQYKFQCVYINTISTLYIGSFILYQKLKMKAAAGKDGITVKMVNRKVFDELWWELFNCGGGVVWFHLCGRVAWSCQCQLGTVFPTFRQHSRSPVIVLARLGAWLLVFR